MVSIKTVSAFLVAMLLCVLASSAWALQTVAIGPGFHDLALGPHMEFLKDPGRHLSLAEVRSRSADFAPVDREVLNPGYTSVGYWVRFRLRNLGQEPLPAYLQYRSRFADHLRLYSPDGQGGYTAIQSGRLIEPSERPLPSREFRFPLTLAPGGDQTFYFYADSADTLTMPLYLVDGHGLNDARLSDYTWLMFYEGLIFAMTVFSLFLLVSLRDRVYGYYILAIVLHHGLFFALFDGLGYSYFGFEDPWWSRQAISVLLCVSMALIIQFGRTLLNIPAQSPRLDRLLVGVIAFAWLTAALSLFLDYFISIRIANPIASVTALLMGATGWISLRKGNPAARYFLLAWTSVIVGGLAYSLKSWGFAPSNFFTEYAWQMGSGIEALLLSMALAERIKVEVRQREQSQILAREAQAQALEVQRRSNEVLEQRVRQRTEELEIANRKLEAMSITDGLTGLHNRRHFQDRLDAESVRCRRDLAPCAVIMLDIDHFKQFNDAYGHPVGDACLRQVAQTLKSQLTRATDSLARYGGEEFIVLLPHTDAEGAVQVGERIRQSVEAMAFLVEGQPVPVTVSLGVAVGLPSAEARGERLVRQADEALYHAKRKGRNCLVLIDLSLSASESLEDQRSSS